MDIHIGPLPTVTLPDGRTLRLWDTVTGSYWSHNDVHGTVIGWGPDGFCVDIGASNSITLSAKYILTIEPRR